MRVVVFANNHVGHELIGYLSENSETELVGLVVHTSAQGKYRGGIIERSDLDEEHILEAPELRTKDGIEWLERRKPQLGVSLFFGHILKPAVLELFPHRVINLHPAYLPWNRGTYPNVWSIVDETPAGVTLHYMDVGIDTGEIIAQRKIDVEPIDTGQTLYQKLEDACIELFHKTWPSVLSNEMEVVEQNPKDGTHYRRKDVKNIDRIDLDGTYRARDLINILRARTFPPHIGAYFEKDGRRVGIRVELEYLDEEPTDRPIKQEHEEEPHVEHSN